jgi:hypothetical protein
VTDKPRYRLEIRPKAGCPVPAIHQLRRLLKALLRFYGLRCVELREVKPRRARRAVLRESLTAKERGHYGNSQPY